MRYGLITTVKQDLNCSSGNRSMWKIVKLMDVLNDIQSVMYDLTSDELDDLIDEVTVLYERYSDLTDARNGDKQK